MENVWEQVWDVGWLTELVLTRSRWADSTYDLVTYFRKNFCASRFLKFCYFWDYSTSRSGTFIFDQTKKYLFTRETWNFKVGAYLLPQPVMSEVSIGNPIQTWIRRNIFYCIPYRKLTQILFPKLIFRNFEVSYLSDEYIFFGLVKKGPRYLLRSRQVPIYWHMSRNVYNRSGGGLGT